MNDDLRGGRVAVAGGNRAASARVRSGFAQALPAREQRYQHTASQSFVSFLPSINGERQLLERGCRLPGRGRSLSFAA